MNIPNDEWQKPSDREIDSQLKSFIRDNWSEPPTALEIAKALQLAVYFSLASGFVIKMWSIMYNNALLRENKTDNEISAIVKDWFQNEQLKRTIDESDHEI